MKPSPSPAAMTDACLDAFIDEHLKAKVLRSDATRLDAAILKSVLREFAAALLASRGTRALTEERQFPILDGPSIPWSAIAPFDHQAKKNHGGQSLEHLAKRGGLSCAEAVAVMECRNWEKLDKREATLRMLELVKSSISRLTGEPSA